MRALWALVLVACSREPRTYQKWALAAISERASPCSISDPPCSTTWTAQWHGSLFTYAPPNDHDLSSPERVRPSTSTSAQLSRDDLETLTELVLSQEFHDGMTNGFACQGTSHEPDTLQFLFIDPTGAKTYQFIERCTHGPNAAITLPGKIMSMIAPPR